MKKQKSSPNNFAEFTGAIASYKDKDSKIIDCNDVFLKYTGFKKRDKIIGLTDYDLAWQDFADIYRKHELDALNGQIYQAFHPSKDINHGEILTFNTVKPIKNTSGKIDKILAYAIEIVDPAILRFAKDFHQFNSHVNKQAKNIQLINNYQHFNLTKRETECFFYLLHGKSSKIIAKILNISPKTIEYYIENIKIKMHCKTRAQLFEKAVHYGLLEVVPVHLLNDKLLRTIKD